MSKIDEIKIGDYVRTTLEALNRGQKFAEGYVKEIEFNIATIKASGYPSRRQNLKDLEKDDEYIDQLLSES